jgi:hypothetical protein
MRVWTIVGLLFTAAILATIPVSPQATQRGVELRVDQAQEHRARFKNAFDGYRFSVGSAP